MRSLKQCLCTGIAVVAMAGVAGAETLAGWSFDTGSSSAEKLTADTLATGVAASPLTMNTDGGGFGFRDAGNGAVPNNVHDGYGFGGAAAGVNVMFTHRADYFDTTTVSPSNRPSADDYTSFGSGAQQGTTAGLGNGHAPVSFTVSAAIGKTITVSNLNVVVAAANPGSALIVGFQEAGDAAGTTVTLNGGSSWLGTAALAAPVIIPSGETRTFTISLNSGALNTKHNIDSISVEGSVEDSGGGSVALAEWTFNTGGTSAERLASGSVASGAAVSGFTMNTDAGGFGFRDFGPGSVPNDEHDGYGFGGNSGEEVMFLHRATYFDASAVPVPRPTTNDYTSFGPPTGQGGQGTDAGLGDGNATVYFTVTADSGKTVVIESVTCHKVGGAPFIMNVQEAGATAGATVTLPNGNQTDTAVLNAPVTVSNGETKTFTMNWNSGALNSSHNLNEFVLNGVVEDFIAPFPVIADPADLVENGALTEYTAVTSLAPNGGANVADSKGDFPYYDGYYAEVDGWQFYYADPDGLVPEAQTGGLLEDTDKLGTTMNPGAGWIAFNSSQNYRNGMLQSNLLDGVSIQSGATYEFVVDTRQNASKNHTNNTFTAALTVGSGSAVTNLANAVSGSVLSVSPTYTLPTAAGVAPQSTQISGAALVAAQSSGGVNIIFESLNTTPIDDWPNSVVDVLDPFEASQIFVDSVSLALIIPAGDVNKDGVIDANDVTLAQSYLDGSIDGGDSATNRQDNYTAKGYTEEQALAFLNLVEFDIDGDNVFDASDVSAIAALTAPPVISSIVFNGSGHVEVSVGGLAAGQTYYLVRDDNMVMVPDFTNVVDSATAASDTATLTDTNPPVSQAFYKVTD